MNKQNVQNIINLHFIQYYNVMKRQIAVHNKKQNLVENTMS